MSNNLVFAGTAKAISIEGGVRPIYRMTFVPDAEYTALLKLGEETQKCVVLQPTSKWQCGYVFQSDGISFRSESDILKLLTVGGHYELSIMPKAKDFIPLETYSFFDLEFDDAPTSFGKFSVVKIKSL